MPLTPLKYEPCSTLNQGVSLLRTIDRWPFIIYEHKEAVNWHPVPLTAAYPNKEDAAPPPSGLQDRGNLGDLFANINVSRLRTIKCAFNLAPKRAEEPPFFVTVCETRGKRQTSKANTGVTKH